MVGKQPSRRCSGGGSLVCGTPPPMAIVPEAAMQQPLRADNAEGGGGDGFTSQSDSGEGRGGGVEAPEKTDTNVDNRSPWI